MKLKTDFDYLKLLTLEGLYELREKLEQTRQTNSDEYRAVLKAIKECG